mmetsp:Transcript_5979/g.17877  ORF Transcript_5979/g.17877 Transcript_5979/m.17877 type:complete len:253 (+) Transcript_5979:123-881(+)
MCSHRLFLTWPLLASTTALAEASPPPEQPAEAHVYRHDARAQTPGEQPDMQRLVEDAGRRREQRPGGSDRQQPEPAEPAPAARPRADSFSAAAAAPRRVVRVVVRRQPRDAGADVPEAELQQRVRDQADCETSEQGAQCGRLRVRRAASMAVEARGDVERVEGRPRGGEDEVGVRQAAHRADAPLDDAREDAAHVRVEGLDARGCCRGGAQRRHLAAATRAALVCTTAAPQPLHAVLHEGPVRLQRSAVKAL